MGLTVAVTGPTGEIGMPAVAALEREPGVERILGMARRPFAPAEHGWARTEYRQGDVRDRAAVDALVAEADVVLHLAFVIMGAPSQTRRDNLAGTRTVIEATVAAPRPRRFVYTSSVAAYGYHRHNRAPLTEDVPAVGSSEHYYARQKAECENLLAELTAGSSVETYVLRPCIVAGPRATVLADSMPWNRLLPAPLSDLVGSVGGVVPVLRPVFPDPGVPLQLVHPDDLATAIVAATLGRGAPGAYNIAGDGEVSWSDVAAAAGGRGVRVPTATAVVASWALGHLPWAPGWAQWVHAGRTSMVVDTRKARRELGWRPAYTSRQALEAMAAALGPSP